jgi:glycosyltransferase involved in cell wall biosynthesis
MPSLWEGFGTTVLEAFATGTPAIISRVSSLPEIAGEAAYFINPVDKNEIADALMKFATDENLRNDFRQKGYEQVKKFDWEITARQTLDVYKSFQK